MLHTEQSPPHNHDEMKVFSKDIMITWNNFLRFVSAYIENEKEELKIRFWESKRTLDEDQLSEQDYVMNACLEFVPINNITDLTPLFQQQLIPLRLEVGVAREDELRLRVKIPEKNYAELIAFYKDLLLATNLLFDLQNEWLLHNSAECVAIEIKYQNTFLSATNFYPQTDFAEIHEIFNDNLTTILHTIQLLLGDNSAGSVQQLLNVLNQTLHTKPSKPIHEQYPNLPLIAYLGKLQFGVLGRLSLSINPLSINLYSGYTLEETLENLSQLTSLSTGSKMWHGCPAIAIIPQTMHVFLELFTSLFPHKYQFDQEKNVIYIGSASNDYRTSN